MFAARRPYYFHHCRRHAAPTTTPFDYADAVACCDTSQIPPLFLSLCLLRTRQPTDAARYRDTRDGAKICYARQIRSYASRRPRQRHAAIAEGAQRLCCVRDGGERENIPVMTQRRNVMIRGGVIKDARRFMPRRMRARKSAASTRKNAISFVDDYRRFAECYRDVSRRGARLAARRDIQPDFVAPRER